MRKALFPVMLLTMALILGLAAPTFAERSVGVVIDDATITTKVKYDLANDVKFGTLKTVQVDTHKGEVTLTGKLRTQEEKDYAGLVVAKVEGVVKVNNLLSVVPDK